MLALGKLERLNVRQGLNLTTPPTKHTHARTRTQRKTSPLNYTLIRDKISPLVTLQIYLLVYASTEPFPNKIVFRQFQSHLAIYS